MEPTPEPLIFHKFGKLPIEIRLKIWGISRILFRRVVVIGRRVDEESTTSKDSCQHPHTQPVLLSVCQESREEAMRSYKQIFKRHMPGSFIYFESEIDTLASSAFSEHQKNSKTIEVWGPKAWTCSAPRITMLMYRDLVNLKQTQSIALDSVDWDPRIGSEYLDDDKKSYMNSIKNSFHNLREVILVVKRSARYMHRIHVNGPFSEIPERYEDIFLSSEKGKEECRKEITAMYEDEKKRFPSCRVPKVIIYDPFDPAAPVLMSNWDRPFSMDELKFLAICSDPFDRYLMI